jgi:hypothetical protein
VFTGSATDPNTGPLVIVLAAAMVPAVLATREVWRSPASEVMRHAPAVGFLGVAGVAAALALSATYPVAPQESTSSAMSGMAMGGTAGAAASSKGSQSATASTCVSKQQGGKIAGLVLANTPYMAMGSTNTNVMNMNGADASAAAGFNTTKPNWHYTGPAIPQTEAQRLLAEGNNGPANIHMAKSGCAARLTSNEVVSAQQYVQTTSEAASRYATPAEAMAAGFVAVSPTDYPVVYYVNPAVVASNAAAKSTLDPRHIDGLVYARTPYLTDVLAAAMYILPSTVTDIPMPYGALVQWHQRLSVCGAASTDPATPLQITGTPPCAAGSVVRPTPYLSMVWQVPVAGGPLAIQPPDIQIVEAATMQQTGR